MTKYKPPKQPHVMHSAAGDRRPGARGRRGGGPGRSEAAQAASGRLWLFGVHPVLEGLANPRRRAKRLLLSPEAAKRHESRLEALFAGRRDGLVPERAGREDFTGLLPEGAVHQGLALEAEPLNQPDLEELLADLPGPAATVDGAASAVLLVLDQVTDPHNVGAILRSAAAFGAAGVLAPRHHAAPETGTLAKSASGALEHVPYLEVGNLARSLERLKDQGFWILGLAEDAAIPLAEATAGRRLALVLGAEGRGLRRLTREHCDQTLRLPTQGPIGQLNVSNAAAIALYELLGRRVG